MKDESASAGAEIKTTGSVDSLLRAVADILEPSLSVLPQRLLCAGDVIAERFAIERLAGSGGMGTIYRARDLRTNGTVALKLMASQRMSDADRFAREGAVLAELSDSTIVRYVAHGITPQGRRFLAMEWLEGEDLGERLARSPLSVEESLSLVRRTCEGIALAHAHGIVHRDIKPNNLFLVQRDPSALKVIDFGIARIESSVQALTQTGVVLGTVGYMAPEQAMGQSDIDARVDLFALGCVLYECLAGRAAFRGHNAVAVLAKVLRDEPPRMSETRPDLGTAFDALLGRLLAKEREARPRDANEVLRALAELEIPRSAAAFHAPAKVDLTDAEQRVVTVLLGHRTATPAGDALTLHGDALKQQLSALAVSFGAELLPLRDSGVFAVLSGRGAATDQATQAARYALALRQLLPELRIGVATGHAEATDRGLVGEAIDRAAAVLGSATNQQPAIMLDVVTASLLGPNFETARAGGNSALLRERAVSDASRLLLGKLMPCVGREKELGVLELTLDECVREQVARALLVAAAPGMGKSRLASEFVLRVQTSGAARVLCARADPMAARSTLSLAQDLIRGASGLQAGDPLPAQRDRLREHLESIVAADAVARLAEFLGEMLGLCSDVDPSPYLRAARDDAAMMSEQTRRAFETWIDAECTHGPVLIVLEDLHWSDAATLSYLESMLRRRAESPLLLLALARPEVHELFPALWRGLELHEIRLGGLTRRAAERLIRMALGQAAEQTLVERIVDRADGNAFYLEELIRHVHEGHADLPETVLVMVQSRLERLDPAARRVLRAASVFGQKCWTGGVAALLGEAADTASWLETLADREILVRSREARFSGEREYLFRHALLREGAYAMLTERDRSAAHRNVAEWLERSGERDPWILTEHFERGGDSARAIAWLVRAALRSLERGDVAGTAELSLRGERLGARGQERGALLVAHAMGLAWSGQNAVELLEEAITLLSEGTTFWWSALGALIWDVATAGHPPERAIPYVQRALNASIGDMLSGPHGQTLLLICTGLSAIGQDSLTMSLIEKFQLAAAAQPSEDPFISGWLHLAQTYVSRSSAKTPLLTAIRGSALEKNVHHGLEAMRILQEAGSMLGVMAASYRVGAIQLFVFGACADAQVAFDTCLRLAAQTGNPTMETSARLSLAMLDVQRGGTAEALIALRPFESSADIVVAHQARLFSARVYAREQRWEPALERALQCQKAHTPWIRQWSYEVEASIYRGLQRPADALGALERAAAEPRHAAERIVAPYLTVAHAETLHALGRHAEARALLHELCDSLQRTAAGFENRAYSRSFLNDIEPHARAFVLARAWA